MTKGEVEVKLKNLKRDQRHRFFQYSKLQKDLFNNINSIKFNISDYKNSSERKVNSLLDRQKTLRDYIDSVGRELDQLEVGAHFYEVMLNKIVQEEG